MLDSVFYGTAQITATADAAIAQYIAVKRTDTANDYPKVDVSGAGDEAAGIAVTPVASGSTVAAYAYDGIGRAKVNGSGTAIGIGDYLKSGAAGVLVKTTTPGDFVVAQSNGISTADGDIIAVRICPGIYPATS